MTLEERQAARLTIPESGLIVVGGILVAAKNWCGLPWPWWIVTLPLWISVALAARALAIIAFIGLGVILAILLGNTR